MMQAKQIMDACLSKHTRHSTFATRYRSFKRFRLCTVWVNVQQNENEQISGMHGSTYCHRWIYSHEICTHNQIPASKNTWFVSLVLKAKVLVKSEDGNKVYQSRALCFIYRSFHNFRTLGLVLFKWARSNINSKSVWEASPIPPKSVKAPPELCTRNETIKKHKDVIATSGITGIATIQLECRNTAYHSSALRYVCCT